jgi:hypothetical protein
METRSGGGSTAPGKAEKGCCERPVAGGKVSDERESRGCLLRPVFGGIDAGVAAIDAAVITAALATITALAVSYVERRSTRTAAFRLELRTRVASVFELLFVVQHAMQWVTWHAVERPSEVGQQLHRIYETDVHGALATVLGAMAQVAALNRHVYASVQPDAHYIFGLEVRVARKLAAAVESGAGSDALRDLAALNTEVKALYIAMPVRVAQVMDSADQVTLTDVRSEAKMVGVAAIPDRRIEEWVDADREPAGPLWELNQRVVSATRRAVDQDKTRAAATKSTARGVASEA